MFRHWVQFIASAYANLRLRRFLHTFQSRSFIGFSARGLTPLKRLPMLLIELFALP